MEVYRYTWNIVKYLPLLDKKARRILPQSSAFQKLCKLGGIMLKKECTQASMRTMNEFWVIVEWAENFAIQCPIYCVVFRKYFHIVGVMCWRNNLSNFEANNNIIIIRPFYSALLDAACSDDTSLYAIYSPQSQPVDSPILQRHLRLTPTSRL